MIITFKIYNINSLVDLYSLEIISTVFEYGRFSSIDTINTALFLRELSWSFVFIFISTSLFQPFFTLPFEKIRLPQSLSLSITTKKILEKFANSAQSPP